MSRSNNDVKKNVGPLVSNRLTALNLIKRARKNPHSYYEGEGHLDHYISLTFREEIQEK